VVAVRDTRRTRLVLGAALIVSLAMIAISYQNGSSPLVSGMRGIAGSVFGGAERVVSSVTEPVGRFFGSGLAAAGRNGQVVALQRQLLTMRTELSAARLARAEYRQLDRLLQVAGTGGYRVVAASVIAFGQGYQQTVTLDAGGADGVRPGQTVLDAGGLVGRVIAATGQTCTVLLASDASSVVGVRLAPSGQIGWVTGAGRTRTGTGLLRLAVLDPAAVLTPGEQLVTVASVHDRPFVPGVPVGVVAAVRNRAGGLTSEALVRPYADLTALGVVGIVIAPPRHDPRYSVLPPRPSARPTGTVTPGGRPTRSGPSPSPGGPSPSPGGPSPSPSPLRT
jgi:rod shape-determining protein MreC